MAFYAASSRASTDVMNSAVRFQGTTAWATKQSPPLCLEPDDRGPCQLPASSWRRPLRNLGGETPST